MSMKQNTSVGHLGTQEEPGYVEDVVRTFHFSRSFCELRWLSAPTSQSFPFTGCLLRVRVKVRCSAHWLLQPPEQPCGGRQPASARAGTAVRGMRWLSGALGWEWQAHRTRSGLPPAEGSGLSPPSAPRGSAPSPSGSGGPSPQQRHKLERRLREVTDSPGATHADVPPFPLFFDLPLH